MKKCLILLLICSTFISCKDDNEKLQEGHYSLSITGKDYCNPNNPSDYLYDATIELSKIGDDTYQVYQKYYNSSGQENISPKSTITIYDGNKIKGKIYTNDLIWREGTIIGKTDGEKIEGLFDGLITCYHDNTAQIKGTFTMKHEVWYPQQSIISFNLSQGTSENANIPLPRKMRVDYVSVYRLKKDCDTELNLCNYDFSNYDNKVKKKITIGNGSCSNNISIGDNVFLRASEEVLINGDFNVPVGAELFIDVDQCNY